MGLREELVGTWLLVSNVNLRDGVESHPFGESPSGQLMLDAAGRCSVLMFRNDLPPFKANNRTGGDDEENRKVVHGCLAVYGTYQLLEAESTIVLIASASTYPNLVGKPARRPLTLDGETQVWRVAEATVGGTALITWRRAGA